MAQPVLIAKEGEARPPESGLRVNVPSPGGSARFRSLDGLRGLAALTVVVYHALLISPALASTLIDPLRPLSWLESALAWTPLHIFWAGREAVFVFFALSGYVLVRPYLLGRSAPGVRYFVRRAVRLYVPIAGSVLFSFALQLVPHRSFSGASQWLAYHEGRATLKDGVAAAIAVLPYEGWLNSALWSMRWEVLFSASLPVVVILAKRFGHLGVPTVVACVVLAASMTNLHFPMSHALRYLPIFGIGVGIGMLEAEKRFLPAHLDARPLLVVAFFAMTVGWPLSGLAVHQGWPRAITETVRQALVLSGVALLLPLSLSPASDRVLTSSVASWLGSRSFSLYLVHEPIIVSSAFALRLTGSPWWFVALATLLGLCAAEVFYRLVEKPTLRLLVGLR